jgi:hypothetical protein
MPARNCTHSRNWGEFREAWGNPDEKKLVVMIPKGGALSLAGIFHI